MDMPNQTSGSCQAQAWVAEFTGRHVSLGTKSYSICCSKGKVELPLLRVAPLERTQLLTGDGVQEKIYFPKSRI